MHFAENALQREPVPEVGREVAANLEACSETDTLHTFVSRLKDVAQEHCSQFLYNIELEFVNH